MPASAVGHERSLADRGLRKGLGAYYTPPDVVARMTKEIGLAFATKEIKDMWASLGSEIPTLTGPAFGDFVSTEAERWALVAKAAGAKLD
jgi:tripartite-type tricarboxylate transporter receptor subunit TctC